MTEKRGVAAPHPPLESPHLLIPVSSRSCPRRRCSLVACWAWDCSVCGVLAAVAPAVAGGNLATWPGLRSTKIQNPGLGAWGFRVLAPCLNLSRGASIVINPRARTPPPHSSLPPLHITPSTTIPPFFSLSPFTASRHPKPYLFVSSRLFIHRRSLRFSPSFINPVGARKTAPSKKTVLPKKQRPTSSKPIAPPGRSRPAHEPIYPPTHLTYPTCCVTTDIGNVLNPQLKYLTSSHHVAGPRLSQTPPNTLQVRFAPNVRPFSLVHQSIASRA